MKQYRRKYIRHELQVFIIPAKLDYNVSCPEVNSPAHAGKEHPITIIYPSIGKKIRKYRKAKGLTQEQLAEKLDLSINYVGALERAEKNLTVTNLINIANVLGVTADMLLCDEIRTGYKIKSSMITEKIEKLSPSDRDNIMQMLDIMLGEK